MSRVHKIQSTFNAGELSPRMAGRTDIAQYAWGASILENFIVQAQGGIKHRPGSRFVLEVKSSSTFTRLVPFVFSTVQAYILEFSNNLIRFYKDEGNIESGGNPLALVTTYTTAELPDLQFAQSADVLFIVHPDHAPAQLSRTSHVLWSLDDIDFQDGPYLAENATTTTLDPAADTGTGIAVVASSATGINGGAGFKASDVGRPIRLRHGTVSGWAVISDHTDATNIEIDIVVDFANATATADWRLGAFGSASDLGYPSAISFSEQRLWLAANPGAPQTVYASEIGLFNFFGPNSLEDGTPTSDHGFTYTIAAEQVNAIRWLNPTRAMLLGTSGALWSAQATSLLERVTPTNIVITRNSINGAASVQPTNVENLAVYVSATKRKIWSTGYDSADEVFKPAELTLLADHITESGIDAIVFAAEPQAVVWGVRGDGVLVGLTYIPDQKVFAWHRHILGGSFGDGDAVVESIAVIPSTEGDPSTVGRTNIAHDQVWLVVKRTINGSTVRYVEFMEDDFSDSDVLDDALFMDSGITAIDPATATISGLDHLKGETVQVLADGAVHPDRTVDGDGEITLKDTYTKVQIGLYANAVGQTLNLEVIHREGDGAQARRKRIPSVTFRLDRSLGGEVCSNAENTTFDPILFRASGDPMDAPPPLFTGDKRMLLECGWSTEAKIKFRQTQPLPWNLVALITPVEISNR